MGTCYYLVRRDNRTGYDLGKAWEWGDVFGRDGTPIVWTDVDYLERRLSESWHDLLMRGLLPPGYLRRVAEDILDWSEGKPFEFHSEHSGVVEDLYMEGWDEGTSREWITGDRHTGHMEKHAIRRKRGQATAYHR